MFTILSRLEYLGWREPWRLGGDSAGGAIDFAGRFWDFAESVKGKPVRQEYTKDSYALVVDEQSPTDLRFHVRGEGIGLFNTDGSFGFSNVMAYAEMSFQALNGRSVIIEHEAGQRFGIRAAEAEAVPEVKFFGRGNMGRVPEGEEMGRCKLGQGEDCCIFLTAGEGGFSCAKFSGSLASMLLDRKAKGTIHARRIGDCRLTGREEDNGPPQG